MAAWWLSLLFSEDQTGLGLWAKGLKVGDPARRAGLTAHSLAFFFTICDLWFQLSIFMHLKYIKIQEGP